MQIKTLKEFKLFFSFIKFLWSVLYYCNPVFLKYSLILHQKGEYTGAHIFHINYNISTLFSHSSINVIFSFLFQISFCQGSIFPLSDN